MSHNATFEEAALRFVMSRLLALGSATAPANDWPLQWPHQHGGLQHPRQEGRHRGFQRSDASDSR